MTPPDLIPDRHAQHPSWYREGVPVGDSPEMAPLSAAAAASAIALRSPSLVLVPVDKGRRKTLGRTERPLKMTGLTGRAGLRRKIALSTLIIGAAAFALMFMRLFFPVPVGLADNGDAYALSCQLGIEAVLDDGVGLAWSYPVLDWRIDDSITSANCETFPTSALALLMGAQAATAIAGEPGSVNLRALLLMYCLVASILVFALAHVIQRNLTTRIVVSAALFVVLADGTFANYAGSLYGELAGVLGVPIAAIGGLLLHRSGRSQWLGLIAFAVGGVLVVGSTFLATTVTFPLVIFLAVTAVAITRRNVSLKAKTRARMSNALLATAALALALCLGALGSWFAITNPTEQKVTGPYHVLSFSVLGNTNDPESVVNQLELHPGVARYVNTSVWSDPSIANEKFWPSARERITYGTLALYFAANPAAAWLAANDAANAYHEARPDYLGTFASGTDSEPQALESRAVLVSGMTSMLSNLGALPLIAVWCLMLAGAVRAIRTSHEASVRRASGHVSILLLGVAVVQFLTVAFGDGIEMTQHMVLAILATALTAVFLVAALLELPDPEKMVGVPVKLRSRRKPQKGGDFRAAATRNGIPSVS